jgi:hypothetical protein
MKTVTTRAAISLAAMTLVLGAVIGFALVPRYSSWQEGSVIAEAGSGSLKLRQIPTDSPGLNDSYVYRCELWSQGLLCKATILHYADFAAQPSKCSIEVVSPSRAIFHIDGYDIECADFGFGSDTHSDSTWRRLNQ